jgi:putative transcriptional regulator
VSRQDYGIQHKTKQTLNELHTFNYATDTYVHEETQGKFFKFKEKAKIDRTFKNAGKKVFLGKWLSNFSSLYVSKRQNHMITSAYRPQAGRFLISEPFMHDKNFQRTVVFLVEHSKEGSLGFVLNRQLRIGIEEVVEGLPAFQAPVFMGGPVEQSTLHYLHRIPDLPNCQLVQDGVYWGGDFDALKTRILSQRIQPADILFFIGYSGWGPQQLAGELKQKAWIVAPEKPEVLFQETYHNLWQELLRDMGDKYKIISNYPVDPSLN